MKTSIHTPYFKHYYRQLVCLWKFIYTKQQIT